MDDEELLRVMAAELTSAVDRCRADIASGLAGWPEGTDPLTAKDTAGRYVLLDALVTLVGARTALLAAVDGCG